MTRDERIRYVCRRLSERVGEVAPCGIGHWGPVWDLVKEPSDVFLDRLAEWAAGDTPDTRARLQAAADAVVRSWRLAGEEWEAQGRPGHPNREEVPA